MIRVALYARYSSDQQREASIADQFRLCRERAEREGWTVVETYADQAISGASLLRPGIQALMQDAARAAFDVVLAEALDRISRDQEDVAGVYKRMRFAGIRIVTLSEGEITHLHVGLKGTMNALFLQDLADKTRRGLRGRVAQGKSGGGLCYGYAVVKKLGANGEPVHGERAINHDEAKIVRRILREFAAGKSPRAIAKRLNAEHVPGPFGREWMDTTIRGHVNRQTGIINNELYIGRIVWNRLRYLKDPETGKRVSRINPKQEWVVQDVPELRIVDDNLWHRVKARQEELGEIYETRISAIRAHHANRLNLCRRTKFLLSGLLVCGQCGGGYTIRGQHRYGCSNHYNRGTCTNGRTISRQAIEARVMEGLRDKLLAPELVVEFIREFQAEANRLRRQRTACSAADRHALSKVGKAIKGILAAIEDGLYEPSMKVRLPQLEREKAALEARLKNAPEQLAAIHPNVAEVYRAKVARLIEALDHPEERTEAAAAMRALIDRIELTPGPSRGEVKAVLHGDLAAILGLSAQESPQKRNRTPVASGVRLSVVAGVGFEPTTFRL